MVMSLYVFLIFCLFIFSSCSVSYPSLPKMGLLAEPKYKQKWSVDPNNLNWKKNEYKTSFGHKMMSKMGWAEGQGLGKTSQGMTRHITAKTKNNMFGIGCNMKNNSEWVAGQDEFKGRFFLSVFKIFFSQKNLRLTAKNN